MTISPSLDQTEKSFDHLVNKVLSKFPLPIDQKQFKEVLLNSVEWSPHLTIWNVHKFNSSKIQFINKCMYGYLKIRFLGYWFQFVSIIVIDS